MNITQKQMWVTTDGSTFNDKNEAEKYDTEYLLRESFKEIENSLFKEKCNQEMIDFFEHFFELFCDHSKDILPALQEYIQVRKL